MLKMGINLSMLFKEMPFMERFAAARAAGFEAVEIQFPYEWERAAIKRELQKHRQRMVLFNLPAGNLAVGDCGVANDPSRVAEFRSGVRQALEWAVDLGVPQVNCLVGKHLPTCSEAEQDSVLIDNLRYAARTLGEGGVNLLVEPLNRYDNPGFLLNTAAEALAVIDRVAMPNVFLQYDFYHAQREGGELAVRLTRYLGKIGHIQIADNPGRHQPGTGEINYQFILQAIDASGYQGYVSLEYNPYADTVASLGWLQEWGIFK